MWERKKECLPTIAITNGLHGHWTTNILIAIICSVINESRNTHNFPMSFETNWMKISKIFVRVYHATWHDNK